LQENNIFKKVTEMNHNDAKIFFLKNKSYCSIDLPPYFNFVSLLTAISFTEESNHEILKNFTDSENVNYKILVNKDGINTYRKFEIINPILYVSLVNILTAETNWELIKKHFATPPTQNSIIDCKSIPSGSLDDRSDKAEQVINW
jgi:RNA-directed DNA polymerase